MKCKYKKFLKAAYINYEEDYCGHGSGMFTKPTVTTPIIVITGTTAIIACAISGATIYYTLDGSTPTSSSTLYTGAITLTLSCTIKAIAVKPGMSDSLVASENYVHYLTQWKIVGNSEVHTLPYPDIPQGYTKCKYLEAHGTEYIELPIGFDNTDEVELTVSFTQINLSNKYAIAPKRWNDNNNRFGFGMHATGEGDVFCVAYGSNGGIPDRPIVAQDTNVHLFTYANYLFKLDNNSGADVSHITFGGTTDNLKLFYGYNSPTKCRIYTYHQVKANNTEINLIPCLDNNNTPCLYDTISGTTYYNDGTGTFGYEIEPQPTEIWSCGEYNPTDGKYHILVQPQGGSIADIALDAPLRKVNDVADTIVFPNGSGSDRAWHSKFFILFSIDKLNVLKVVRDRVSGQYFCYTTFICTDGVQYPSTTLPNILCNKINTVVTWREGPSYDGECIMVSGNRICIKNPAIEGTVESYQSYLDSLGAIEIIYPRKVSTAIAIDVPKIQKSDSYTCVISQGAKAVEWSSFETE